MLVLSRKKSEKIWIGESVLLTVIEMSKGEVRLAFEAPEGVSIDREEVRQKRMPRKGRQGDCGKTRAAGRRCSAAIQEEYEG